MHPALNGAGDEAIRTFKWVSACDPGGGDRHHHAGHDRVDLARRLVARNPASRNPARPTQAPSSRPVRTAKSAAGPTKPYTLQGRVEFPIL